MPRDKLTHIAVAILAVAFISLLAFRPGLMMVSNGPYPPHHFLILFATIGAIVVLQQLICGLFVKQPASAFMAALLSVLFPPLLLNIYSANWLLLLAVLAAMALLGIVTIIGLKLGTRYSLAIIVASLLVAIGLQLSDTIVIWNTDIAIPLLGGQSWYSFSTDWLGHFAHPVVAAFIGVLSLLALLGFFLASSNRDRRAIVLLLFLVIITAVGTMFASPAFVNATVAAAKAAATLVVTILLAITFDGVLTLVASKGRLGIVGYLFSSLLLLFSFLIIGMPMLSGKMVDSELFLPSVFEYQQLSSYLANTQGKVLYVGSQTLLPDAKSHSGMLALAKSYFGDRLIDHFHPDYYYYLATISSGSIDWIIVDRIYTDIDATQAKQIVHTLLPQVPSNYEQTEYGDDTDRLVLYKAKHQNSQSTDLVGKLDIQLISNKMTIKLNLPGLSPASFSYTKAAPSGNYVVKIGNRYLGPYSIATPVQSVPLAGLVLEDLQSVAIFELYDVVNFDNAFRFSTQHKCNQAKNAQTTDSLCIESSELSIETPATVLLHVDYQDNSTGGKVKHCIGLGEESYCNQSFTLAGAGHDFKYSVLLELERNSALRELTLAVDNGSVSEYKLTQQVKLEPVSDSLSKDNLSIAVSNNLQLDLNYIYGHAFLEISGELSSAGYNLSCLFNTQLQRCIPFKSGQPSYLPAGEYKLTISGGSAQHLKELNSTLLLVSFVNLPTTN